MDPSLCHWLLLHGGCQLEQLCRYWIYVDNNGVIFPARCADTLLDNLTVEEMLLYTAEMKNPVGLPLAAKRARVRLVLEQLALTGCRGVRIGNALSRGISGALLRPCRTSAQP